MSATVATVEATVGRADWTVIFLLRSRDIINAVVAMDSMGGEGVKAGRVSGRITEYILEEEEDSSETSRQKEGRCVCSRQCQSPNVSGTWKKRSGKESFFWRVAGFLAMTRGDEGGRFGSSSKFRMMDRKEQGSFLVLNMTRFK